MVLANDRDYTAIIRSSTDDRDYKAIIRSSTDDRGTRPNTFNHETHIEYVTTAAQLTCSKPQLDFEKIIANWLLQDTVKY